MSLVAICDSDLAVPRAEFLGDKYRTKIAKQVVADVRRWSILNGGGCLTPEVARPPASRMRRAQQLSLQWRRLATVNCRQWRWWCGWGNCQRMVGGDLGTTGRVRIKKGLMVSMFTPPPITRMFSSLPKLSVLPLGFDSKDNIVMFPPTRLTRKICR